MSPDTRWLVRLLVTADLETTAHPKNWGWDGLDADAVVLSVEAVGIVAPEPAP